MKSAIPFPDNIGRMNTQIRAVNPRMLILTHLRKTEGRNLDLCTRMWKLSDPVFPNGRPFNGRLSITEEGSFLPEVVMGSTDYRAFSWTGAIDDNTQPPGMAHCAFDIVPISHFYFVGPERSRIILGGGNLDFCLLNTFESLIREKVRQNQSLEVIIPLAMVYYSPFIKSPLDYVLGRNQYTDFLANEFNQGRIGNYRVWIDGRLAAQENGGGPSIELKWYTVLKRMFSSPVFPEIDNSEAIDRVFGNFITPKAA